MKHFGYTSRSRFRCINFLGFVFLVKKKSTLEKVSNWKLKKALNFTIRNINALETMIKIIKYITFKDKKTIRTYPKETWNKIVGDH